MHRSNKTQRKKLETGPGTPEFNLDKLVNGSVRHVRPSSMMVISVPAQIDAFLLVLVAGPRCLNVGEHTCALH